MLFPIFGTKASGKFEAGLAAAAIWLMLRVKIKKLQRGMLRHRAVEIRGHADRDIDGR
ncbi:hypothetical protein ACQR1N_22120 [Bradyrhizobium sp. HKCCYLRH1073]|nr:hypothetical protein [Bradyrhizobium sp. SZCCHNS3018]